MSLKPTSKHDGSTGDQPSSALSSNEEDRNRRIHLFVSISVLGICTLIPFGLLAYRQGNSFLAVADLTCAFLLAANLYHARRHKHFMGNVLVGTAVAGLLFTIALINGSNNNTGFVWYYTFPLLASFLLGSQLGMAASLGLLLPAVAFFLVDEAFPTLAQYTADFKIRFTASYLVVCLFAYFSEHQGALARARWRASRDTLEDGVRERTRELKRANDALEEEVAERRRIEEDLRHTRDYLQIILDGIPEAVMVINPDHSIELANRAMQELWREGPREERILTCHEMSHHSVEPCHGNQHPCPLEQVLQTGRPLSVEHVHYDKEGNERVVEVLAAPIFGDGGEVQQVIESSRDITDRLKALRDRQEMERKFLQAQKMESLGLMAGGVAHDFNNILMAIMGNTEVARRRLPPDSPAREQLRRVEASVERAAALASQMLAYAGSGKISTQTFDLNEMIRDFVHLLQTVISKKATVRYDLAPKLPAVAADPAQLGQVFMNLLTNASEALEDRPGTISVRTGRLEEGRDGNLSGGQSVGTLPSGPAVYLEVEDTGCGMDEVLLQQIFDPFFSTKFTGRGLGLAAVIGIVKGHGGSICVRSKEGSGTIFRIVIPAAREVGVQDWVLASHRESEDAPPWRGDGIILLADDELVILDIATALLEESGFRVVTATNGREALDRYVEYADRIVATVLDMAMPEMNGEEVFHEIRRRDPQARVVMVSGYDEADAAGHLQSQGLAGFLHKPFRSRELLTTLRRVLEGDPEDCDGPEHGAS